MAVNYDSIQQNTRTATTDPYTFTPTIPGTSRGLILFCLNISSATNQITSVTVGGRPMTFVNRGVDTTTEPGDAQAWFLGTDVPTGSQTVSVDLPSATGDDIQFYLVGLSASSDIIVVDSQKVDNDATNPSVTTLSNGFNCMTFGAIYSGLAAPASLAVNANMSAISSVDHGNNVSRVDRQTTAGTGNFTFSYTAAVDDVAMVALSVTEVYYWQRHRLIMPPALPPAGYRL